jgi:hypothetical protein
MSDFLPYTEFGKLCVAAAGDTKFPVEKKAAAVSGSFFVETFFPFDTPF